MKKALLLILAIAILSCKEDPKPDYAIISGTILNKPVGELTINDMDRTFSETLEVAKDGSFTDTLSTDIKSYVLYDGTNPVFLYVEDGVNLTIDYDAKDFKNTLSITGEGSETSNYLIAKSKLEKESFGSAKDTYSLDEDSFKESIKTLKLAQDSVLNTTKGIPKDFIAKETRNTHYFYLKLLTDYEGAHKHFTKNKDFKVSENFLSELNDLDYQNEDDYKFSRYYKSLVKDYYEKKSVALAKKESLTGDEAYYQTLRPLTSKSIKNGLLFAFANRAMNHSKDLEYFYKTFLEESTNEENKAFVTEKYNKLMALAVGSPSPKFTDYKNYDGSTSSLDDFKGKYVYIDVWATWCGPCIREIPSLKKTEAKYHNKNIEFVSISIDKIKDYEKWKNMINDKELKGIQLFADSDWSSSFVKDYQIQGIPKFILIDPDGNIVKKSAPRPSNPKLIELFNSLNI